MAADSAELENRMRREEEWACPRDGCNFRHDWEPSIQRHQNKHNREDERQESHQKRVENTRRDEEEECPMPGCDFSSDWPAALGRHQQAKGHYLDNLGGGEDLELPEELQVEPEPEPEPSSEPNNPNAADNFQADEEWACPVPDCDFVSDLTGPSALHARAHDDYDWSQHDNDEFPFDALSLIRASVAKKNFGLDEDWECPVCEKTYDWWPTVSKHRAAHPDYDWENADLPREPKTPVDELIDNITGGPRGDGPKVADQLRLDEPWECSDERCDFVTDHAPSVGLHESLHEADPDFYSDASDKRDARRMGRRNIIEARRRAEEDPESLFREEADPVPVDPADLERIIRQAVNEDRIAGAIREEIQDAVRDVITKKDIRNIIRAEVRTALMDEKTIRSIIHEAMEAELQKVFSIGE